MEAYFAGGDEGFEAWLAENVPVVETATDPKDVNNIRGGVHSRGDVLKDDAGNPILDTNGEQVGFIELVMVKGIITMGKK